MALTQSAILPGPSWDEEVVPALRKRKFQSACLAILDMFIRLLQVCKAKAGHCPSACPLFLYQRPTNHPIPTTTIPPYDKSPLSALVPHLAVDLVALFCTLLISSRIVCHPQPLPVSMVVARIHRHQQRSRSHLPQSSSVQGLTHNLSSPTYPTATLGQSLPLRNPTMRRERCHHDLATLNLHEYPWRPV